MEEVGPLETVEFVSPVDTNPLVADLPIFSTRSWSGLAPLIAAIAVLAFAATAKPPLTFFTLATDVPADPNGPPWVSPIIEGLTQKHRLFLLSWVRQSKNETTVGLKVRLLGARGEKQSFEGTLRANAGSEALSLFRVQVREDLKVEAVLSSPELRVGEKVDFVGMYGSASFCELTVGVRLACVILSIPSLNALVKQLREVGFGKLEWQQRLFLVLFCVALVFFVPVSHFLASFWTTPLPFEIFDRAFPGFVSAHAVVTILPFLDGGGWVICPAVLALAALSTAILERVESGICELWPDQNVRWAVLLGIPVSATAALILLVYLIVGRVRLTAVHTARFRFYAIVTASYTFFSLFYHIASVFLPVVSNTAIFAVSRFVAIYLYLSLLFHGSQETDAAGAFADATRLEKSTFPDDNPMGVDVLDDPAPGN
jgi:hypothetical protein